MKKYLNDNSYYIIRLLGTQVGITIFSMMLTFATASISDSLSLAVSIFAVLFYCALIYSTCWEMGAKNAERIDAGRLVQSKAHGFGVCAVAYIPLMLLIATLWVCYFDFNAAWAQNVYYVVDKIITVVFAMYRGIVSAIVNGICGSFSKTELPAFLVALCDTVSLLPGIATAGVAYLLGRKGIFLFTKPTRSIE